MLLKITGETRNYDWGSRSLIPDFFSLEKTNNKIAEIWFGTHPQGPAQIAGSSKTLTDALGKELSFLAKFLSAESALSIQVHPSEAQAREGFAREEAAGISLADPTRNYKDQSSKPETLIALTPFEALCGFREVTELANLFSELAKLSSRFEELAELVTKTNGLRLCFERLLSSKDLALSFPELSISGLSDQARTSAELAKRLLISYPQDTGALVSLMLNFVQLSPGEAIFLPAGNLHAYLSGLGVEVMKASDNVIRGGLTSKHVDTAELLRVVEFEALADPKVATKKIAEGLVQYQVSEDSFFVYRAEVSGARVLADLDLGGNLIALCTSGEIAISTSLEEREVLKKSEAAFASEAKKFSLAGNGEVFLVFGG